MALRPLAGSEPFGPPGPGYHQTPLLTRLSPSPRPHGPRLATLPPQQTSGQGPRPAAPRARLTRAPHGQGPPHMTGPARASASLSAPGTGSGRLGPDRGLESDSDTPDQRRETHSVHNRRMARVSARTGGCRLGIWLKNRGTVASARGGGTKRAGYAQSQGAVELHHL